MPPVAVHVAITYGAGPSAVSPQTPTGPLLIEYRLAAGHEVAPYDVIVKPLLGGVKVPVMHMLLEAALVPTVAAHAAKGVLGL